MGGRRVFDAGSGRCSCRGNGIRFHRRDSLGSDRAYRVFVSVPSEKEGIKGRSTSVVFVLLFLQGGTEKLPIRARTH